MIKVAIIGGSGYTGGELLRLLKQHPDVKITAVTSERSAGKDISALFPNLKGYGLKFEPFKPGKVIKKADVFFLCLPHKASQDAVSYIYKAGKKVIDLSADFRLKSPSVYKRWYQTRHMYPALLKKSVYGLPELYRDKIRHASIVANPGCYPTSAILALAPVIGNRSLDNGSIIIDSKSGISGAGRSPALPLMFSEASQSVKAYSITTHRHTPEIEQELSLLLKKNINIVFTPHLIPMDRGILSTIYVSAKKKIKLSDIQKRYREFYSEEPFVRILKSGEYPTTKSVLGSNYCDISLFLDTHSDETQTLIIVSVIDNLLKGASGQAVHNMNIMYGLDETAGLKSMSAWPG